MNQEQLIKFLDKYDYYKSEFQQIGEKVKIEKQIWILKVNSKKFIMVIQLVNQYPNNLKINYEISDFVNSKVFNASENELKVYSDSKVYEPFSKQLLVILELQLKFGFKMKYKCLVSEVPIEFQYDQIQEELEILDSTIDQNLLNYHYFKDMKFEQIIDQLNNTETKKLSFMDYEFLPIEQNINRDHKYFINKYELKSVLYFKRPVDFLKAQLEVDRQQQQPYLFLGRMENKDIAKGKVNIARTFEILQILCSYPLIVHQMFHKYDIGLGIYQIRYLENDKEKFTYIDDYLPCQFQGTQCFGKGMGVILFPSLFEKWLAKLKRGYCQLEHDPFTIKEVIQMLSDMPMVSVDKESDIVRILGQTRLDDNVSVFSDDKANLFQIINTDSTRVQVIDHLTNKRVWIDIDKTKQFSQLDILLKNHFYTVKVKGELLELNNIHQIDQNNLVARTYHDLYLQKSSQLMIRVHQEYNIDCWVTIFRLQNDKYQMVATGHQLLIDLDEGSYYLLVQSSGVFWEIQKKRSKGSQTEFIAAMFRRFSNNDSIDVSTIQQVFGDKFMIHEAIQDKKAIDESKFTEISEQFINELSNRERAELLQKLGYSATFKRLNHSLYDIDITSNHDLELQYKDNLNSNLEEQFYLLLFQEQKPNVIQQFYGIEIYEVIIDSHRQLYAVIIGVLSKRNCEIKVKLMQDSNIYIYGEENVFTVNIKKTQETYYIPLCNIWKKKETILQFTMLEAL